jgi:MFS family permease
LLDRVGARLPLILGPTIVAAGFALFAASGVTSSYWVAFLLPIVVVGFGMAITVAPLTTTVINAVPRNQAGVASGINNAVASVATLFAIAIFGAVTLSSFNRTLNHQLEDPLLSFDERQLIERARGTFVIETSSIDRSEERRLQAEAMIKGSLSHAIHLAMLLAAGLALAGAAAAAVTIRQNSGPINGKGGLGSDQKNASVPPR